MITGTLFPQVAGPDRDDAVEQAEGGARAAVGG
jgi:hypothetical protein